MKKLFIFLALIAIQNLKAQKVKDTVDIEALYDSIEHLYKYDTGTITLKNGIAKIKIPKGFKYLNAEQSEKVLTDLFGNPKSENMTLGMILREDQKLISDTGYIFNIEYDAMGYVKDDDADKINYNDLLKQIKEDTKEENKKRQKEGYEPVEIIGWASPPFYDKEKKILYWAKEARFGNADVNTLNYNIRILGRKGVLVLNAIATMPNYNIVKNDIDKVIDMAEFTEGNQYSDFNPKVDEVAAWTIGGLVAGKVLAKAGFFALILKFWKLIAVAVVAFFGLIWKRIKGKKSEETEALTQTTETTEINSKENTGDTTP